jgi:pyruvate/2-oxoglutarate dehydrogenase complex dihydrolipoamide acyltransferase (E2) component
MPALRELQQAVARALLDEAAEGAALALIAADRTSAAERLAIHRNNLFASLTEALAAAFPAVRRLVHPRFFAYAAHEFIRARPPRRAVLAEFGADFADFLAGFPPCRALAWLPDVARLEWLMHHAATAADRAPIAADALAGIAAAEAPRLVLALQPALGLLESPFPVDRIWRANRAESPSGATVDLAAGGVRLQVDRRGGEVMLTSLDAASFAFRSAVLSGAPLATAAAAALAREAGFDLAAALGALFAEGAVVGLAMAPAASNDGEMDPALAG